MDTGTGIIFLKFCWYQVCEFLRLTLCCVPIAIAAAPQIIAVFVYNWLSESWSEFSLSES